MSVHTAEAEGAAASTGEFLPEATWTGRIFSGGWVDAPATLEVVEPATGDVIGTAGVGDAAAVARACAAAARAQHEWAAVPAFERAALLRKAADLLDRHAAEIRRWIVRESGSIPGKADVEIKASINQLHQSDALIAGPLGYVLPSLTPGRTSMARRVPVGVVGVITPWNFPVVLAMRSVAPGARARQRGRAQVRPEHAGDRRRARRAHLRGGGPARRRARTSSPAAPTSARRWSPTRTCTWSRSPARRRPAGRSASSRAGT